MFHRDCLRITVGLSLMLCFSTLASHGNADQVCCVSDELPRAAVHASATSAPVRLRIEELDDEQASARSDYLYQMDSMYSETASGDLTAPLVSGCDLWWGEAEYRLLWTTGNPVPPLVSANSTVPPRDQAGVLGMGDTQVLLGDERLDRADRTGTALTLGFWFDACRDLGVQATWFYAGGASDELNAVWQSAGVPVLARPFFNVATGVEDAQLVAYPDVVEGLMLAQTHSDLRSAETLLRTNWCRGPRGRIDILSGYRYLGFHEGLWLEEQLTIRDPAGNVQIGTEVDLFDQFRTRNHFHGGMLGVLTSLDYGALSLDVATKLGVGNVSRKSILQGQTQVRTPTGGAADSPGGLLVLPSNMGTFRDNSFGLLPELDIKARLLLSERLSVSVGYQLLFLTNVYRTGQQIDRRIDSGQLSPVLPTNSPTGSGQTFPSNLANASTLCAQGLSLGISYAY